MSFVRANKGEEASGRAVLVSKCVGIRLTLPPTSLIFLILNQSLMPAGPEYVLVDAREPYLFVIRRQLRGAPGAPPTPQALYYVLDGSIYQAPPLGAVLSSRVVSCQKGGAGENGV